ARLADQPAHVLVGHLDLDRDGAPAAVDGVHLDLLRLVGDRPGDELHQGAVVDGRARGPPVGTPEAAVPAASAKAAAATGPRGAAVATPARSIRIFPTLHTAPGCP